MIVIFNLVYGYSTYGAPSEFGNLTNTTCYIGGDEGIVNCTGDAYFTSVFADVTGTANNSDYWNNLDSINTTSLQAETGDLLGVKYSWLTSLFVKLISIFDTSTQGLLLAMNFNSETINGNSVLDSSTYNNHGTVVGATHNSTGGFNGGGAFMFDGMDDGVTYEIDTEDFVNLSFDFTYSFWYKKAVEIPQYPATDTTQCVFPATSYTDGRLRGCYRDRYCDNGIRFRWAGTGGSNVWCTGALNVDEWYHIVLSRNRTYINGYVNGVFIGKDTANNLHLNGSIGFDVHNNFNGTIDEARVYNRSLSAEEISRLYLQRTETINSYVSQKDILINNTGAHVLSNLSAYNYFNKSGDLNWIRPENVFDIDDEDIESDLNTYVDIAGDIMAGNLDMDDEAGESPKTRWLNENDQVCQIYSQTTGDFRIEAANNLEITKGGSFTIDGTNIDTKYVLANTWTSHDNYPTACTAPNLVRGIGDSLTCVGETGDISAVTETGTTPLTFTGCTTGSCAIGLDTDLVSHDTTPELGGYLDTAGQNIGSTSDEIENIYIATNSKIFLGDGQEGEIYYDGSKLIIKLN